VPTIAVDAMGGERAPEEIVKAAALISLTTDIECLLVGDEARVQAILEQLEYNPERIGLVDCGQAIGMDEEPAAAAGRRDTSLTVALQAVKAGGAEALVSAGNTAACVLASTRVWRLLPGARCAALAAVYPRQPEYPEQDRLALVLDVGASLRCDARDLVDFAVMGSAYARCISKVPSPRVGLLNVDQDVGAGDDLLLEAHRLLAAEPDLNFVGNVEGHDLVRGRADVIVCEGLVGNVARKLFEGVSGVMVDVARAAGEHRLMWRLGLRLLSEGIERLQALTDYSHYGGAPILGFDRLFIKCHGRSNAHAVANAIKVAAKAVRDDVAGEIAGAMARRPR